MNHICGQCKQEFETEVDYLNHTCNSSGFKPTQIENLGEAFMAASVAALARGEKRSELEKEGKTREEAIAETREIGKSVA